MNKALKTAGKILLGALILLAVFLLIMFVYHRIKLKSEENILGNYPGQLVEVDGHNMNVYTEGSGEHTLVFLPGSADTAPVYSFKPLYSELSREYRCVVPEKFGYGGSEVTDGDRSFETIVKQYREALQKADVKAPYIICPYSLSGLEALTWAQMYPEDIEGIIGIDMAFPESYKGISADISGKAGLIGAARATGLIRLIINEGALSDTLSPDEKKTEVALGCRNFLNKCNIAEVREIPKAVESIESASRPDVPMYLFLTTGSETGYDKETWQGFAHRFTEGISDISFTELECTHGQIVGKETEQLLKGIREFVSGLER